MTETPAPTAAVEIAVYTAREPTSFAARHPQLHGRLASYDGFVDSLALRRADAPSLFADVVVWRDLAAAVAASDSIGADPGLAWFGTAIDTIRLFGHLRPITDLSVAFDALATAPFVEIAAYRPASPAHHEPLHRLLHTRKLRGRDGVVGNVPLVAADPHGRPGQRVGVDPGMVADLVGWSSPAAMEATQAALLADPELAAFFDPEQAFSVFDLFEPTARSQQAAS